MSRTDVLAEFSRGSVTQYHDTHAMADEIVRLREQLAAVTRERDALRENYAMSLEESAVVMRQREETSSQLWDCMNERDGWKHRVESMETALAKKTEAYRASVLAAEAETKQWKEFFYGQCDKAERMERDGVRLGWLQKLEERLTSIEIEHVAGEFWISEMADDGATCLKTWRGVTLREAFDRALDAEAQT